jgi:ribose transport system ATP-binding protein
MVEIAKALGRDPRILILDEATSALNAEDTKKVYGLVRRLRDQGAALIYITHHLREAAELADECTVLRNGKCVAAFQRDTKSESEIISMMIGRTLEKKFPPKPRPRAEREKVLEIRRLSWGQQLQDIELTAHAGEIVGLGGLDGQGQREVLLSLFGVLRGTRGQVLLDGRPVKIGNPAKAKKLSVSIAMIPEDRKTEGLLLRLSVAHNITLSALDRISPFPLIRSRLERRHIREMVDKLHIRLGSIHDSAASLSGGNQQKVVLAKWLLLESRCLLLMDPTRGIDVGTKQEIYQLLRELADGGTSILLFSTDHDELVGLCDRVYVLYRGRVVADLQGERITEYAILEASLNLQGRRTGPGSGSEAGGNDEVTAKATE